MFTTSVCEGGTSAGLRLLLLSIILLGPHQSWGAKQQQACVSSCGKIANISYPFRLKNDPDHCGKGRYELECINEVAVLRFFSGEYYVQSINYRNYTIRVVDPNIQASNCSSLPRYLLYRYNFSNGVDDPYHATIQKRVSADIVSQEELFGHIIYFNCPSPVNGYPYYVDATPCVDPHIYAVIGDLELASLKPGCHVIATTPWALNFDPGNVSYMDIHRQLVLGFELSWLQSVCDDDCGSSSCYLNDTAGKVQCDTRSCHYIYHTTDQCGKLTMFARYTQATLNGILNGMYTVITIRSEAKVQYILGFFDYPTLPFKPYLVGVVVVGRYGLLSFIAVRILFGVTFLFALLIYKWRRRHLSMYENIENFLQDNNLMPIRYSYKEIKKMTRGFKDKLGEGGFGSVYKGKLRSGPYVAIKILGKSKGNGQDFINEVATIGRIHHVHVVRLIGFCVERSKRALVYEFMPNGSLDKYIFSKEGSAPLSHDKIYEISLGVARGIAYLHHGCDMQILHFDIKPHNILLDENFIPKVSDFGLAKLYPLDDSIVTLTAARGTIGYMAPELFYKNIGGVSYKADVYSFGMLLMEMASRRKNLNPHAEHSSQLYFPLWIYDQFTEEKDIKTENLTKEEKELAKKMFIVALWCIQLKPVDRPPMNKVVEMLESQVESLEMPPKPELYPHETVAEDHEFNSEQTASSGTIYSPSHQEEIATDVIPKNSPSNGER